MSHNKDNSSRLNIAFYPWFALGHLTSFLRIANKLAERGHKVSYLLPKKTQSKLSHQNHHPNHLTFIPIDVPAVEGLPVGAETTNDVPNPSLIMTAMDMTRDTIESLLIDLKPDVVLYDFTTWMPELGRKNGFKTVHYITSYIARIAYFFGPHHHLLKNNKEATLAEPPLGFPTPNIRLHAHEAAILALAAGSSETPFGVGGFTFTQKFYKSFEECDAIGVKTCMEMEGAYCQYVQKVFAKPVLLAGPMLPRPPSSTLDHHMDAWLKGFGVATVVYCALGSECVLELDQFQEIVFGLELTGRPFLAALKPPKNYETIESALPDGFTDRIKGRGIVDDGWVQQQLILQYPSVGCFITHCGAGSLSEAMASECQVVLMPQAVDQFINARMMSLELKIGVEASKSEDGRLFTRDAIHKAVSMVMEEDSEVGREVRINHAKWREFVSRKGLEDSYVTSFIQSLQQLCLGN